MKNERRIETEKSQNLSARLLLGAAAVGLALASAGCNETTATGRPQIVSSTAATQVATQADGSTPILTKHVPMAAGPKRVVAVGKFDTIGAFTQNYGEWDIGGGLAAMLVSALKESGRFIVVERANVAQVLSEQELKGSGAANKATGPELGNLTGAQFLVYGAVTEFGTEDSGGGVSLGTSGGAVGTSAGAFGVSTGGVGFSPNLGGLFGSRYNAGVSHQSSTGKVALDIRVVDTTTGEVIETHRVSETVDASSWDVSAGYKNISLGTNQFYKTPLGEAARAAITHSVLHLVRDAENKPWTAQVVENEDGKVILSAGGNAGLRAGDDFVVERVVRRLTDPATGQVLSVRKKTLGMVRIAEVEDRIAIGTFTALDVEAPARGDLVVKR
ncbi:MAG: CsgG/HfaB family protein [Rhodospirillales bacterium]